MLQEYISRIKYIPIDNTKYSEESINNSYLNPVHRCK